MDAAATVEAVYRAESRRVLATLIRLLGDFDRAEEAHARGVRDGDGAMGARRRARQSTRLARVRPDASRPSTSFAAAPASTRSLAELARELEASAEAMAVNDGEELEDDRLRLIFTCCHPALTPDAQVALTLREVCGLTTEEIARAFLTTAPTVAQRIVRAKAKIRDARIPYQVPSRDELPDRLDSVLRVVYLVFNEGYSASAGGSLTRARPFGRGHPARAPAGGAAGRARGDGLLALMLLHESRRAAQEHRRRDDRAAGRPRSLARGIGR